jgi:glycosyltransferase involved in cell wall biosynthesis
MKINICYDMTILGTYFSYPDSKTGIYRVVEEILFELLRREETEITLTSMSSMNLALSSIACPLYIKSHLKSYSCDFDNTFISKLGIQWFYSVIYKAYFSKKFQSLPRYSLKSIFIRALTKTLDITKLCLYDCNQYFDSKRYDIFHSTYYKLPSKELTCNLPRLLTIYDLIPIKFSRYISSSSASYFKEIINSIDINNDWVICISEYTRQEFCEYTRMPIERVFVCPLAADKQFHPVTNLDVIKETKENHKIPENQYFLCLASQLQLHKNIPHLIDSFVTLIHEQPNLDINLVLIGTNRYKRPEIEKVLEKIAEYQDRIIMTGYVPDEDLSAIYSGATAFIFPSLYEGFGLPVLEAMQCGTPVISSNSTSLPEVVGDAGILVDPTDQNQLCQAMLDVLTDEVLRESLKQKGLERAKQFSWKKCADQTVEIYKKIIDSK